jgi:hypothetical protein
MIFGDKRSFAIEIEVNNFFHDEYVGEGKFFTYINNQRYGIDNEYATTFLYIKDELFLFLNKLQNSIEELLLFSSTEISIAYYCQNYSDVDLSKLNENLLNLAKHLVAWSPESAFDDGSYIIHFDYGDKTRIIGFKSCMIKDKCMVQKDSVNEVFITRVEFERILRESLDYLKR